MPYLIVIAGLVVIDQLSKYFVKTGMHLYDSIPVIQNIFHITYIQNPGAAFSILEGRQIFLIAATSVVLAGALVYLFRVRKKADPVLLTGLSVLISGGIGNLIDRARSGYVVDFFDFRIWPVFNVADICVCVGCGLILIYVMLIDGKKNRKKRED